MGVIISFSVSLVVDVVSGVFIYRDCLCRCLNQVCLYFLGLGFLEAFGICWLLMLARGFVFVFVVLCFSVTDVFDFFCSGC